MGVFTCTDEVTSPIPPSRLFKALILDSNNLIPKLIPTVVKSIEFIEGDGGVGSIRQITFQEDQNLKSVKNRIDAIDPEKFLFSYTYLEGDESLLESVEKIVNEVHFVPGPDGGSISKTKSTYHTKGDHVPTEEEIKISKEKALAMYKLVEGYLLQNPDAYA